MKLSDSKFVRRSVEAARAKPHAHLDGADLSKLRGVGDSIHREAQALIPGAEREYEPVSFQHPDTGRRIYGWLVAVDPSGDARVETGDGAYALVPTGELRRIGAKEDRAAIQAQLRRAISQVSLESDGVRADMHETSSPISMDDGSSVLVLGYATSMGEPTAPELRAYVSRFHPTAQIVEVDASMPGRIGVAVRQALDSEDITDGEVIETLDPDDVKDDDADDGEWQKPWEKKDAVAKTAIPTPGKPGLSSYLTKTVDPDQAASALLQAGADKTVQDVIETYFANGGARAIARMNKAFNTHGILAAAIPIVQKRNPALYKQVAQLASQNPQHAEMPGLGGQKQQPGAFALPGQAAKSMTDQSPNLNDLAQDEMANSTNGPLPPADGGQATNPQALNEPNMSPEFAKAYADVDKSPDAAGLSPMQKAQMAHQRALEMTKGTSVPPIGPGAGGVGSPEGKHIGPMNASKRASVFGTKTAKAPSPAKVFDETAQPESKTPAMKEVFMAMKLSRLARRGDYIVAKVEWNPKHFSNAKAAENGIRSFVGAMTSATTEGANFGITGKVQVLSMNEKKGEARIQFASEFAGPAPLETTRGD